MVALLALCTLVRVDVALPAIEAPSLRLPVRAVAQSQPVMEPLPVRVRGRRAAEALSVSIPEPPAPRVAPAAGPIRAFLTVLVDGVDRGEWPVWLDGADVLLPRTALEAAGLDRVGTSWESVGGALHVRLGELPGVAFAIDEEALTLSLSVDPALLPVTVLDLRPEGPPPGLLRGSTPSAWLNYGVRVVDLQHVDGLAELGIGRGDIRGYTGVALGGVKPVLRGRSTLTVDLRGQKARVIVGDADARGGRLGGSAVLGGVQLARSFELDPWFMTAPTLDRRAVVTSPSTAEVYVDGRLVGREQVGPGALQIDDLPASLGAGDTRLVLRDALGREQVLDASYYRPSGLLAPGLHEYAYTAGLQRHGLGSESFGYGAPAAIGVHRIGLSRSWTAGARLEAAPDRLSIGLEGTLGLPVGQIDLALAGSAADQPGAAGTLAYSYVGKRLGVSGWAGGSSPRYATLGLDSAADRPVVDVGGTFAMGLTERIRVSLASAWLAYRDRGVLGRSTIGAGIALPADLQLDGSVAWTRSEDADHLLATLGLVRVFGRTVASLRAEGDESPTVAGEVQRSLGRGPGVGYRVGAAAGAEPQVLAQVDGQTTFGRASAAATWTPDGSTSLLSASGGVVAIGGRVLATAPVEGSYALVRVPDVRGVRVYADHTLVGRTDRRGDRLVVGLVPYYANRLGVDDRDVPIERTIDTTELLVAPAERGGAVAEFGVPQHRYIRGVIDGAAFGEVVVAVDGGERRSLIGSAGAFELDLPPGPFDARALTPSGACSLHLDVPAAETLVVQLGTIPCHGEAP